MAAAGLRKRNPVEVKKAKRIDAPRRAQVQAQQVAEAQKQQAAREAMAGLVLGCIETNFCR